MTITVGYDENQEQWYVDTEVGVLRRSSRFYNSDELLTHLLAAELAKGADYIVEWGSCDVCAKPYDVSDSVEHCGNCGCCHEHCQCLDEDDEDDEYPELITTWMRMMRMMSTLS